MGGVDLGRSSYRVLHTSSCRRVARMIHASQQLGLGSGLVLAVPIPAEAAAEGEAVEGAIKQALAEAARKGVRGSEVSA